VRLSPRNNYFFTQFCRLPTQIEVLAGPVLDLLRIGSSDEVRIVVFGCSIGAEPYSIASVLRNRRPDVRMSIECFDIDADVIAHARAGRYSREELAGTHVTPDFIDRTFDAADDGFTVKPEIMAGVRFAVGDVLDETLIDSLRGADVVIAQNFLYHLPRPAARGAFAHLFTLLKPRSALLVDGADLDMRTRLTAEAGLQPCLTELERIHAESRITRGYAWPHIYWALEPFDSRRADATRRYATIFLSEAGSLATA
jgi:chemotaxis protein methyltransferase CheR